MIVVIAKPPSVPDEVSDGSPNADISSGGSPERAGVGMTTVVTAMRFRRALRKQSSFWSATGNSPTQGEDTPLPFEGLACTSSSSIERDVNRSSQPEAPATTL
ncbi:unnamed protein product [Effrenium voratum]|uniref:Uncharacterized protein n=1 Tax=Effrenium voratum TaxID=2562239 RepID=A0AA36HXI0_9DINO|nr:unnamed protein product [Effrenium voratum]